MRRGTLAFTALLGLLLGCDPVTAEPEEQVTLLVGTGEDAFELVDSGEIVPLMKGPQGGYHLWIAFRCGGCRDLAIAKYGAQDAESSAPITMAGLRQQVAFSDLGFWQDEPGLIGHLTSTDPENYVGRQALLRVSLHHGPDEPAFAEAQASVQIGDVVDWHPGTK